VIETREDAFLGGRLSVRQPVYGYRAGADPVFLAAAIPVKPGQSVLELGCGVGTALCCLMARVSGLSVTGVERDPNHAQIARENCAPLDPAANIVLADIVDLPAQVTDQSFDHVFFNPPFFDRTSGPAAPNPDREGGRGTDVTLGEWVDVALKRTRPGGILTLIHRTPWLPDAITAIGSRAGDVRVLPLQPRRGRVAKLFILQAKKGSNAPFCLLPSLILHKGDAHLEDGDSYTDDVAAILRKGAPLSMSI